MIAGNSWGPGGTQQQRGGDTIAVFYDLERL